MDWLFPKNQRKSAKSGEAVCWFVQDAKPAKYHQA
jgi:hypothetical protein